MRLFTPAGVFSPLSDTWLLAEQLRAEPGLRGGSVLDVCTSSGALAIASWLAGAGRVTAVDMSWRAVLGARLNARLNRASVRVLRGDLYGLLATGEREEDLLVLRGLAAAAN